MRNSPENQRRHLLNDFMQVRMKSFWYMAHRHSRAYGLTKEEQVQDILSQVLEVAWVLASEIIGGEPRAMQSKNFEGLVFVQSREKVRDYAHSELGHAPASGMSGVLRRRASTRKIAAQLESAYGRTPTVDEVVEETNRHLSTTRSNAKAQGALVKRSDLIGAEVVDIQSVDEDSPSGGEDFLLHPAEGQNIVRTVIAHAQRLSEDQGDEGELLIDVAHLWLGNLLVHGTSHTHSSMARELGVSAAVVRKHVASLKALAVEVLSDQYSITKDDYMGLSAN